MISRIKDTFSVLFGRSVAVRPQDLDLLRRERNGAREYAVECRRLADDAKAARDTYADMLDMQTRTTIGESMTVSADMDDLGREGVRIVTRVRRALLDRNLSVFLAGDTLASVRDGFQEGYVRHVVENQIVRPLLDHYADTIRRVVVPVVVDALKTGRQ